MAVFDFEVVIASFLAKQSEAISRFSFQDYESNPFFLRQKKKLLLSLFFAEKKIVFAFIMLSISIGARHQNINCNSYI